MDFHLGKTPKGIFSNSMYVDNAYSRSQVGIFMIIVHLSRLMWLLNKFTRLF